MKDALKQYVLLRKALVEEKAVLENRLARITDALASEKSVRTRAPVASVPVEKPVETTRGGGEPVVTHRGRGGNPMSLKAAVFQVTRKNALTKREILDGVQQLGYRFKTSNPVGSLNAVLYSNRQFTNVGGKFSPV